MKTVRQALADEVLYPLPGGLVDNRLMTRGLDDAAEATADILRGPGFTGALADCLLAVVEQSMGFSEADKSVSAPSAAQAAALRSRVARLYASIGEEAPGMGGAAVTFGVG